MTWHKLANHDVLHKMMMHDVTMINVINYDMLFRQTPRFQIKVQLAKFTFQLCLIMFCDVIIHTIILIIIIIIIIIITKIDLLSNKKR